MENVPLLPRPQAKPALRILSLLWFCASAGFLVLVLSLSFWILHFAFEEQIKTYPIVIVFVTGPLFGLISLVLGIAFQLRAKFTFPAAMLCTGILVFLGSDDSQRTPAPDFGPIATADAPESCAYLKMAKGTHGNITTMVAIPQKFSELFIATKPADFDTFLTENRDRIIAEWNADTVGQAWLEEMAKLPIEPRAIVHTTVDSPIIAFSPFRAIASHRLAYALVMSQNGRDEEASEHLRILLRASYALKRIGVGAVDQMVAVVMEKKVYEAIIYVTDRARSTFVSPQWTALLRELESAPKMEFVAERTILGDAQTLRDITDRISRGTLPGDPFAASKRTKELLPFFARFVIHPKRMEREILEYDREISALVAARKLDDAIAAEERFIGKVGGITSLRNPGGRKLAALAAPAFHKVGKVLWEAEDSRLALIKQLKMPEQNVAPTSGTQS